MHVSKSVQTTPLVLNPVDTGLIFEECVPSTEYFIDVKSIMIDGHVVNLNPSVFSVDRKGQWSTKISTLLVLLNWKVLFFGIFLVISLRRLQTED